MQGKLEDGGIVSGPLTSTTALVLTSAFQRLWKETGSDRFRMEFGNKVKQQHAARTERGANRGRGGTLSYEGVPAAESDVC